MNTDVFDVHEPLPICVAFTTERMLIGGTQLISNAIITPSALLQNK